jgi:hypothetical protein
MNHGFEKADATLADPDSAPFFRPERRTVGVEGKQLVQFTLVHFQYSAGFGIHPLGRRARLYGQCTPSSLRYSYRASRRGAVAYSEQVFQSSAELVSS